MSTRSGIGIQREDGTVVGVYCHSDGYPEGVGKILQEHYCEPTKLSSLVALGDISSLEQDIGEKHPFDKRPEGSTTFYGRDRGEPGTAPRTFSTREDFRDGLRKSHAEFLYLATAADAGDGIVWEVSKAFGRWRSLELVLEQGVDALVEPDPDRGPDIVVDHVSGRPGTAVLRAGSRVGRQWLAFHVDQDFGSKIDGLHVVPDDLSGYCEHAEHDGLVVDHDDGPLRPSPTGAADADIVVKRHFLFGSPVLVVRYQSAKAIAWGERNRHPDVPSSDDVDLCLCHPKALPKIVGARREGLVVVIEGGDELQ